MMTLEECQPGTRVRLNKLGRDSALQAVELGLLGSGWLTLFGVGGIVIAARPREVSVVWGAGTGPRLRREESLSDLECAP
jgi:hypothetical protein